MSCRFWSSFSSLLIRGCRRFVGLRVALVIVVVSLLVISCVLMVDRFQTVHKKTLSSSDSPSTDTILETIWSQNISVNASIFIRPLEYTALIHPSSTGSVQCQPFVLVVVHSSVNEYTRRSAIRSTWGNTSSLHGVVLVRFMIGTSVDPEAMRMVQDEAHLHDDIIQQDFVDDYTNLTLKSLMTLKWSLRWCRAWYIIKCDEDMFLNLPVIVDHLRSHGSPRLILGHRMVHSPVIRLPSSKYFTPRYMYPLDEYPPYVSGTAYILGLEAAERIYSTALSSIPFHMEDVFVTGICAQKAGLRSTYHSGFFVNFYRQPVTACRMKSLFSFHQIGEDELYSIWAEMHSVANPIDCSSQSSVSSESIMSSVRIAVVFMIVLILTVLAVQHVLKRVRRRARVTLMTIS